MQRRTVLWIIAAGFGWMLSGCRHLEDMSEETAPMVGRLIVKPVVNTENWSEAQAIDWVEQLGSETGTRLNLVREMAGGMWLLELSADTQAEFKRHFDAIKGSEQVEWVELDRKVRLP